MILCCGEALIDMLPGESRDGQQAFIPRPGGSVFNSAIALGRLGVNPGFFSGLSTDYFGQLLSDTLKEAAATTDLAVFSDRPTTLALVTLTDGSARYTFYDEGTAGRMLDPTMLPAIGDHVQAMLFGGISLAVEPCGSAYEALCSREAGQSTLMLDPNIRPDFITDETAFRARMTNMISAADIVKVSDEDLDWLYATDDPRKLLDLGPKVALLTEGASGARAVTADHDIYVQARDVKVADTVGAGDTFNAGFLATLNIHDRLAPSGFAKLDEPLLRRALTLGVRAAAITVSRIGANPPWASEI